QGDGRVDSEHEIVCGDVGLGTFELHEKFLEPGPALAGDQPMDSPGLYPGPGMGVNAGKVFTISFRLRYRVLATGRASPIDAFPVGSWSVPSKDIQGADHKSCFRGLLPGHRESSPRSPQPPQPQIGRA